MGCVPGKAVLLTSVGSGIGRATGLALALGGADIMVDDINLSGVEETAEQVLGLGRKVIEIALDVTQVEAARKAVVRPEDECGPVDILLGNAGIANQVPFVEMNEVMWARMFNAHSNGTSNCFQAVLPGMKQLEWDRVINTASVAGMEGVPQSARCAAVKAVIIGFTRSLALEFAGSNITVNAVAPGPIDNILRAVEGKVGRPTVAGNISSDTADQVKKFFQRGIPMREVGKPKDIARAHLYPASDDAVHLTG